MAKKSSDEAFNAGKEIEAMKRLTLHRFTYIRSKDGRSKDKRSNDPTSKDKSSKNTEHRMTERQIGPNVENYKKFYTIKNF
jgi:hypothetical protein